MSASEEGASGLPHRGVIPILVPDVGAVGERLRICAWHVAPGEMVDLDETVLEVQFGGAVVEISAPCRGKLVGPIQRVNQVVLPGEPVGVIEPICLQSPDASDEAS